MDANEEAWQRRIRDLYANVEELYSHVDVTVIVLDCKLSPLSGDEQSLSGETQQQLAVIAARVLSTGLAERDIALDQIGRFRVHAFPLAGDASIVGVACVLVDDGARRELFVRSAMAIFDGYRQNEAALLDRERKALEEAQRANRQRDQFVAIAAHELQGPMTSVLLWERVLRDSNLDAATRATALDAIHESTSGASLLVGDLLDVSRAMNGKLRIERGLISMTRLLEQAIEDARRRAGTERVEIVTQLDPQLGDVHGDSRRLRQVFDNLLSNALKCTNEGTISVIATQEKHSITVEVRDTGRGIAPEFLPHIFEAFSQGDEQHAGAGLGLGLAIAHNLVSLHGGTLSASSAGLGRGAQFIVILPRASTTPEPRASEASALDHIRVLVVDDDPLLLDGLLILLRSAGAHVVGASSAAGAYAIVAKGDIDIIVSDISMPGEDGYSLLKRVRAMETPSRAIPAIAVTAMDSDLARERALSSGFNGFVTKPIDIPALIANIGALVPQPS